MPERVCGQCGASLAGAMNFCMRCGVPLRQVSGTTVAIAAPIAAVAPQSTYAFLAPGETVLMEGRANMQQLNIPPVDKGGKLILTNRRLVFIAHAFNFGSKFDEIPLSEIAITGNDFNLLMPTPNMIRVVMKDGEQYEFVVTGAQKEAWKQKIAEAALAYQSIPVQQAANQSSEIGRVIPTEERYCAYCGTPPDEGKNFCIRCGKPFHRANETPAEPAAPRSAAKAMGSIAAQVNRAIRLPDDEKACTPPLVACLLIILHEQSLL